MRRQFRLLRKPAFSYSLAVAMVFVSVHLEARPRDTISGREQEARLAELQHIPWDGEVIERTTNSMKLACRTSVAKIDVKDPLTQKTKTLELKISRPRRVDRSPVVIIVPPISGATPIDHSMAYGLCTARLASIIADINDNSQPQEMPAWGHEDVINRSAVLSLRTVIDFAQAHPKFDANKIGMMGTSLGGIDTSIMAGVEPERLKAIVISVGGGNLPYTMARSTNKRIRTLRDRRMAHLNMASVDEYEDVLHDILRYDPLDFASRARPERILMFHATRDTMVPYKTQRLLYEALGRPMFDSVRMEHVTGIIYVAYSKLGKMINFIQRRFGLVETPVPEILPEAKITPQMILGED